MTIDYRSDIDGLRAVAVLVVVIFHAFPHALRAGFIGVDIFFVISGYLISSIIFERLRADTFSFWDFYARRIKRIFPALIIVMTSCYAFGWLALLTDEFAQLGKHIAAGAGFASNFVLWQESGYFDVASEAKPLLHLWSLGIEEQFYLVMPVLLWFLGRHNLPIPVVIAGLACASMAINLISLRLNGVGALSAFYSPLARVWELLAGCGLAWLSLQPNHKFNTRSLVLQSGLAWLGLGLIAASLYFISPQSAFPGGWALLPVVGAGLVIAAGSRAWPNRIILSNRLLVGIGLISFPLYLWHWPLLSLARIVRGEELTLWTRVSALLLATLLAWLTYRFVERPVRTDRWGKQGLRWLMVLMLVLGLTGLMTRYLNGIPQRDIASARHFVGDLGHEAMHDLLNEKFFPCASPRIREQAPRWGSFVRCKQSKASLPIDVALIGDSHAEHLFLGLAEAMPGKNIAYYIKASPPFLGNPDFADIFQEVLASQSIKEVIVAAQWSLRISQVPESSSFEDAMQKVLDALSARGKVVFLADDNPDFPFSPHRCKRRIMDANPLSDCGTARPLLAPQFDRYVNPLNRVLERNPQVKRLDIQGHFCDLTFCKMNVGAELLYRDSHHFNILGSRYLGRQMTLQQPSLLE